MAIDIYSSRSLSEAVNQIKVTDPFILKTVVGNKRNYKGDKIDYEVTDRTNSMARFVNPNSEPINVKLGSKKLVSQRLYRTYESKTFTAGEVEAMVSVGQIYGDKAARDKEINRVILEEVELLKGRVLTAQEFIAAQFISKGSATIDIEGNSETIDLGFVNNVHSETLSNDEKWDTTTASIMNQFRSISQKLSQRGYPVQDVVLGTKAANALLNNEVTRKHLDNNNFRMGQVNFNQMQQANVRYLGSLYGLNVWEYDQVFTNAQGNAVPFIDQHKAVFFSKEVKKESELAIGSIQEFSSGNSLVTLTADYYMRSEISKDKKVLEWSLEQISLPIFKGIGGLYSVNVVDA
jgi:hypothetical protein